MNHKTLCIVFVFKEHCDQNAFQFTVTAPCIRSNHCARAYLQKKEEKEETSSKSLETHFVRGYLQRNEEKEETSWKSLEDAKATFCHNVADGQQWIANMWQIGNHAIQRLLIVPCYTFVFVCVYRNFQSACIWLDAKCFVLFKGRSVLCVCVFLVLFKGLVFLCKMYVFSVKV